MRIVCLDDDELIAEITTALLEDLGHDVFQSTSAEHALHLIATARDPIDMLVTDVHLAQGGDGARVASIAQTLRPDLVVLFFTGDGAYEARSPTQTVLRKPCSLGALERAIEAAVRAKSHPSLIGSARSRSEEVGMTAWTMRYGHGDGPCA